MKVYRRTAIGWSKVVNNKSKTHCDKCGLRLWINPGGGIYCNGNWIGCNEKGVLNEKS